MWFSLSGKGAVVDDGGIASRRVSLQHIMEGVYFSLGLRYLQSQQWHIEALIEGHTFRKVVNLQVN